MHIYSEVFSWYNKKIGRIKVHPRGPTFHGDPQRSRGTHGNPQGHTETHVDQRDPTKTHVDLRKPTETHGNLLEPIGLPTGTHEIIHEDPRGFQKLFTELKNLFSL